MVGNDEPDFLLPKLPESLALFDEVEDNQSSINSFELKLTVTV